MRRSTIAPLWIALAAFGSTEAAWSSATEIRSRDLRQHVRFLASDEMAGRDTGSAQIAQAERYVAERFREVGLEPLPGHDGSFVDFTLYRRGYDREATSLALSAAGQRTDARAGAEFRPFGESDEGSVEGPVVFAGYGITAPEHGWDDYAGLDVAGKLVLVLRHEPRENDPDSVFDGVRSSRYAQFRTKIENARAKGAAGLLLVTDPLHHPEGDDLRFRGGMSLDPPGEMSEDGGDGERLVAVQISRALARRLVAASGRSLEQLQRAVDDGEPPSSFSLGEARAVLSVERDAEPRPVAARNVAGILRGSDPVLRDQWIVVGAHHDHIGAYAGPGDTVFNGADDNASGVAGVLELAEWFGAQENRPKRSLVFMTFSGEEKGLLGSRASLERSLIPREQVVFMLNLDMIGRNPHRSIEVHGDGFVRGLRELVEAANRPLDLDLAFAGTSYMGNSDHDPFYRADVPFAFLFSGIHEDYHQRGDHAGKLSFGRMRKIVELGRRVVAELADREAAPSFINHVGWLGIRIDRSVVVEVAPGSRGDTAGLRAGDRLIAVGETDLDAAISVGEAFRAVDPGSETTIAFERDAAAREVGVVRARPGYFGVGPGPLADEVRRRLGLADDRGFVLNRVMADGPAAAGGLERGDVVLSVGGRPVGLGSLRDVLYQVGAGETVAVEISRNGRRERFDVTLGERPER